MSPLHLIVLAAGKGTRMKSVLPKVLQPIAGKPMLGHVLDAALRVGAHTCHVVYGHGGAQVQNWAASRYATGQLAWAEQAEQLGTAHAVQQAMPQVPDDAVVVVAYGDVPLISADTLKALADAGAKGLAVCTVTLVQPKGYGRILRNAAGNMIGIVEENDADAAQKVITEVNTGLMAAPAAQMRAWLQRVQPNNAKGEYYLTDVVAFAVADGASVLTVAAQSPEEVEGVNDKLQLAAQERVYQRQQAEALMRQGVTIIDPARLDIRGEVEVGRDVTLDVGVVLEGKVVLGDGVRVGAYSHLKDVTLGAGSEVLSHCVLEGLDAAADCRMGPFSRVRPGTQFAEHVHIGNFVEIKKSKLGDGTKAGHLAYLGDAEIGARVNVSAGVITCNYDGANKHLTTIGDDAFIGTDSQLVAPVTIERGAYVAAGSTITKTAPADALTICRARDTKVIANWPKPTKRK